MTTTTLSLISEVQEFLSRPLHRAWINGKAVESSDEKTFDTYDPGTGERLATVAHMTGGDVDAAVCAAQQAFQESGWAQMPPNERGVMLHRLAYEVEKRLNIIAQIEALEAGKIESQAQGDVENCVSSACLENRFFEAVRLR